MSEWICCHNTYSPAGAKIALPEPDQIVMLSYMDRDGNKYIGMGEYTEEDVLITRKESKVVPEGGMRFLVRSFLIYGDDESAAVPYDEKHVYCEQHGYKNCFRCICYAWKPVDEPAQTKMNGFPVY